MSQAPPLTWDGFPPDRNRSAHYWINDNDAGRARMVLWSAVAWTWRRIGRAGGVEPGRAAVHWTLLEECVPPGNTHVGDERA